MGEAAFMDPHVSGASGTALGVRSSAPSGVHVYRPGSPAATAHLNLPTIAGYSTNSRRLVGFPMLSILVGHSYFLRLDPKQFQRAKPYPPLATREVAAMLRGSGHKVALFDAMLAEDMQEYARCLQEQSPQLLVIYEDNFNFLTKMCLGAMRRAACEMISTARARGARVIVAGSDASDAPDAYLGAGADAVLIGEGL